MKKALRLIAFVVGLPALLLLSACSGQMPSSETSTTVSSTAIEGAEGNSLSTPSEVQLEDDISGLVFLHSSPSSQDERKIITVDPDSGQLSTKREFLIKDKSVTWGKGTGDVRRSFSTDYTKVVATRSNTGGDGNLYSHLGYVDQSGEFINMSTTAPAVGDFVNLNDVRPSFDQKDNFYFGRMPTAHDFASMMTSKLDSIYIVKNGADSAEKVELEESGSHYEIQPDGSLFVRGSSRWVWSPNEELGCSNPDDVSVDGLCVRALDDELYSYKPMPRDEHQFFPDKEQLLPETNNRTVRDAKFSPDGTKVAFLVSDRTGTGDDDLYILTLTDGSTVKVPTAEQISSSMHLIDWRD